MLPAERRKEILLILQQRGSVTISDLSARFPVSEETIRRDLLQMEQESLLSRVYGGAYLSDIVREAVPFQLRKEACREAKQHIAEQCMQFIHNGDTLFLDSSTTALYIAERIRYMKNVTVITNAHHVVAALVDCRDNRVIAVGGELDHNLLCFTGGATLDFLRCYHADKAFVSCTGVSLSHGLTDSDEMEGRIRGLMLQNAQKKHLIADATKFGKTTLFQISPIDAINAVICDQPLSDEWNAQFIRKGIQFFS